MGQKIDFCQFNVKRSEFPAVSRTKDDENLMENIINIVSKRVKRAVLCEKFKVRKYDVRALKTVLVPKNKVGVITELNIRIIIINTTF